MGRPIKKFWTSAKEGSAGGDLQVTTNNGDFTIRAQKGTGKYLTDDPALTGHVRLVDGAPAADDEARLQHNGKNVRKINQYRIYYFDGTSDIWRDTDAAVVGTFIPAPFVEGTPVTATGDVDVNLVTDDNSVISVSMTNGGNGYTSAPVVTFSASSTTLATGTAIIDDGKVTGVTITEAGSYLDADLPITVTFAAP